MSIYSDRLKDLRAALNATEAHAFILPVNDEFLGEYVPASAERLAWLTGFTGSSGLAAVLPNKAVLFTDGRYTLQASQQLDASLYECINSMEVKAEEWIAQQLEKGQVLAYDPKLHSVEQVRKLQKAFAGKYLTLKPLETNPVDMLWFDRPAPPSSPLVLFDAVYAGETVTSKRGRIARAVSQAGADAALIISPESSHWLLNVRGRDLEFTPVALSYAIIDAEAEAWMYMDAERVHGDVIDNWGYSVSLRDPAQLEDDLNGLGERGARIMLDPAATPAWFHDVLTKAGAVIVEGEDPCLLPKALKNEAELKGIRDAHIEDGVALSRLMHWLEGAAEKGSLTEMQVADKLLSFRSLSPNFLMPSFATIAGSGPNGAIVHYRADAKSNRTLQQNELLLLDSGGQYACGTTDVTRTIAIGTPSAEQCDRFTRVLKGHIALANAVFPEGTSGTQLDVLARAPLWAQGLDYDHGTGHGVGCSLSVHEGPQRIGKRGRHVELKPGMILSNEPGYYKAGAYGIRIENLVVVEESQRGDNGKPYYGFATLTCAPIDTRLINLPVLNASERAWVNHYHEWVLETLSPRVEPEVKAWLEKACKRI